VATGDTIALLSGHIGRLYHEEDVKFVSVLGAAGDDAITVNPVIASATVSGGDGDDHIFGGGEDDSLSGNAGGDSIDGGFGNDRVAGNGGRDKLYGQAGDDRILGGAGGDWLFAVSGHDTLLGGGGRDQLFTSFEGGCVLHGNAGDDFLHSDNNSTTQAADSLFGDAGTDTAKYNAGDDLLSIEDPILNAE